MTRPSYRLWADGRDIAPLRTADAYLSRARGLLFTRGIEGALLISPGNSVHGLGMTYSLDVALLDSDLVVVHTLPLRPFGVTRPRGGVKHVLEAERGALARWGLTPGTRLEIRDAPAGS
jgi:uncharacterized membrane protein (UPF0127 family)